MMRPTIFAILFFCASSIATAQVPATKSTAPEPALPVIDYDACPFEGCAFRKWIVSKDVALYSTWKNEREPVTTLKKGQVVAGLTGVHLTFEPDRIQVLQPLPELGLQPGDIILLYMNRGEGFADIWANGKWWKEYDCSFIAAQNDPSCLGKCSAKEILKGRKEWWVQVKTSDGLTGWSKAAGQFNCMDMLGADEKCDALQSPSNSPH